MSVADLRSEEEKRRALFREVALPVSVVWLDFAREYPQGADEVLDAAVWERFEAAHEPAELLPALDAIYTELGKVAVFIRGHNREWRGDRTRRRAVRLRRRLAGSAVFRTERRNAV